MLGQPQLDDGDENHSALCYTYEDCEPFGIVNQKGKCELCNPILDKDGNRLYRFPDATKARCQEFRPEYEICSGVKCNEYRGG